jgi:hypothetical protein
MGKTPREKVYQAIDTEREYQQNKWPGHTHTLEEYILYMYDYLDEAKHLVSRGSYEDCFSPTLEVIRKVTALGVACMEDNGAIERKIDG